MTIVRNYSDLSPAMRAALIDQQGAAGTVDALVRRGLAHRNGSSMGRLQLTLTEAGGRARDHIQADVPAKVAVYLDKARELGLDVHHSEAVGVLKSWTISSPNPIDDTQVWLYWGPGARGGRLAFTIYCGPNTKTKRNTPIRHIRYTLESMADSLQRHHVREAAKAETARVAAADRIAECQAALAQVFAELDGAVVPTPGNLLHEELNLSTVHANDGTDRPLCGAPVLGGEMTAVDYPVDCAACLRAGTLDCGCPAQIVTDEGHQEGCPTTLAPDRPLGDPTRTDWFMVGQYIHDNNGPFWLQIAEKRTDACGAVRAVAATWNEGYEHKRYWYGDHPEAIGGLDLLEGDHVGLADQDRRRWPTHNRSALDTIRRIMVGQVLSGFALIGGATVDRPACVLVNVPAGTDPTRHLILLQRYVPYLATVELRSNPAEYDRYPTIAITPKEN